MILTNYFTSQLDSQRGIKWKNDDDSIMGLVLDAIRLNEKIVIFHDLCSPEFIARYNHPCVTFVKVELIENISLNDYRFYCFLEWLSKSNINENIFISDLFDVRMNLSPSSLPEWKGLYVGIHNDWKIDKNGLIADEKYVWNLIVKHYTAVNTKLHNKPILMAGTWGGNQALVIETLLLMIKIMKESTVYNANLSAFQRVCYEFVGIDKLWLSGMPFHSNFRQYQYTAQAVFIHK